MSEPETRSSIVQNQLAALDELVPVDAQRIRAALPREAIARVDAAGALDWEPMETLIAVLDTTLAVLGSDEATRVFRYTAFRVFRGPIVKTFADGVSALLSISPLQALRWVPKLDPLINRNAGSLAVVPEPPNATRVVFTDVPRFILESPGWHAQQHAAYAATLEFLRAQDGSVTAIEMDKERGRIVLRLAWR
jgi:hypothetical protein